MADRKDVIYIKKSENLQRSCIQEHIVMSVMRKRRRKFDWYKCQLRSKNFAP